MKTKRPNNTKAWRMVRDDTRPQEWKIQLCEQQSDATWLPTAEPWFCGTCNQGIQRLKDKWLKGKQPMVLLQVTHPASEDAASPASIAEFVWHTGLSATLMARPAWTANANDVADYRTLQKAGLSPIAIAAIRLIDDSTVDSTSVSTCYPLEPIRADFSTPANKRPISRCVATGFILFGTSLFIGVWQARTGTSPALDGPGSQHARWISRIETLCTPQTDDRQP